MKNVKLANKIIFLSLSIIIVFSLTTYWVYSRLKSDLYLGMKTALQQLVVSTGGIVDYYVEQQKKRLLSEDQAKSAAVEAIRHARFDGENYFFILDTQVRMILHPIEPELEGQVLSGTRDPDGKTFVEMAKLATTSGEGFVSYQWLKSGGKEPVSKISFIKLLPEWGWIIGSGVYVDDVETELSAVSSMLLVIMTNAILISLLLAYYVSRSVTRPLSSTVRMIEELKNGNLDLRLNLDQHDEVGQMARALDGFADNMRDEVLAAFNCLAKGDFTFEAQGVIRDPLAKTNAALKQVEQEREAYRVQLLQAQKIESIGRLAGGVAHDFNNMLAIISGNVELALRKLDSDKSIKSHLQQIKETTSSSANLTRQLLGFARKQTIAPHVLNLNHAIEDMLKMLIRLIGEDVELVWKPAPLELKLLIDPTQLDQILTNLVVNARDAVAGRGTLALSTELISIDEDYCRAHPWCKSGEYVQLSVSDDGCGMSKEVLEHLFEPFYTTKDIDKGTGLGLATVYGIVKQNNGFINFYSEPDHGTTVRTYFPQVSAPVAAETTVNEEVPARGHETVLLVEDEVKLLEIGQQILEEAGYQVIATSDPLTALQLAADHEMSIDLLLTDVIMPKLNGKELAERMLAVQPGIKVAYMSGYATDIIAARGLLEDGVQLLQKPFTTEALTRKLREVLDS